MSKLKRILPEHGRSEILIIACSMLSKLLEASEREYNMGQIVRLDSFHGNYGLTAEKKLMPFCDNPGTDGSYKDQERWCFRWHSW